MAVASTSSIAASTRSRSAGCTAARVGDVAAAIRDMVTQSSGPVFAASAGLVLAARAAGDLPAGVAADSLRDAGALLAATRPTNNHIRDVVATVLAVLEQPAADRRWRTARRRGHDRGRGHRRPLSRIVGGAGAAHRRVDPRRRTGPDALLGGSVPHRRGARPRSGPASRSSSSAPRRVRTCRVPGSPRPRSSRWATRRR